MSTNAVNFRHIFSISGLFARAPAQMMLAYTRFDKPLIVSIVIGPRSIA
jgi:hypothetical protein